MAEKEKPPGALLVVSSQTDQQAKAGEALRRLEWPMREHAANILRIVRGAGKPYDLARQMAGILQRFEDYRSVTGHYPSSGDLGAMLRVERDDDRFIGCDDDDLNMMFAERGIVSGALQVAASELVGQSTQQSRGETEMHDGMRRWEEARERYSTKVRRGFSRRQQ